MNNNDANLLQEQELNDLRQKNIQMRKEADELWVNLQTKQFEFEVLEKAIKNFIQRSQMDISNLKTQLKRTHTNHKKAAQSVRESTNQTDAQRFLQLAENFRYLQRDNEILINIISSLGQNNRLPEDIPSINHDQIKESLENIEKKLDDYSRLKSDFEMLAFLLWRTNSSSNKTKMNTKEDELNQLNEIGKPNNKLEGDSKSPRSDPEEKID
jgi:hypothetical protein